MKLHLSREPAEAFVLVWSMKSAPLGLINADRDSAGFSRKLDTLCTEDNQSCCRPANIPPGTALNPLAGGCIPVIAVGSRDCEEGIYGDRRIS